MPNVTEFTFQEPPRIDRCPYCGTGRPQVAVLQDFGIRGDRRWALYTITCCSGMMLAQGQVMVPGNNSAVIERLYPDVKRAAVEVPEPARRYLQQAFETLQSPDAAAVMAGSAVDAMLKHLGFVEGSVYNRIDEAVAAHVLTPSMGEWAHEVRLGSNRPRHADKEAPHVSPTQARQSVEFTEALGHYLFVLSSRVNRGIADAKEAVEPGA